MTTCWSGYQQLNLIHYKYELTVTWVHINIGGFRGGRDEGATAPPFFLYFQNALRFCLENRFIKCSLILRTFLAYHMQHQFFNHSGHLFKAGRLWSQGFLLEQKWYCQYVVNQRPDQISCNKYIDR